MLCKTAPGDTAEMEFMRRKPTEALLPLTLTARVVTPLTLTKALSRPTSVGRTTELIFLKTSPGSFTISWAQQARHTDAGGTVRPAACGLITELRNDNGSIMALHKALLDAGGARTAQKIYGRH